MNLKAEFRKLNQLCKKYTHILGYLSLVISILVYITTLQANKAQTVAQEYQIAEQKPRFEIWYLEYKKVHQQDFPDIIGNINNNRDFKENFPPIRYPIVLNELTKIDKKTPYNGIVFLVIEQKGKISAENIKLICDVIKVKQEIPIFASEAGEHFAMFYETLYKNNVVENKEIILNAMDSGDGRLIPCFGIYLKEDEYGNESKNINPIVFIPKQIIYTDSVTKTDYIVDVRKMSDFPICVSPSLYELG